VPPCLICLIAEGRIHAHRVYEDDLCLAFLDIRPVAPGHILLVPKAHAARVEDLSPEQARALFSALYKILTPVKEAVGADATTIGINDGPGSGQEIPHVHIHVIPRRRGDGGGIIQSIGPGGGADLSETAEKIRAKMANTRKTASF
jgi:histidine triad (HIT) family protein